MTKITATNKQSATDFLKSSGELLREVESEDYIRGLRADAILRRAFSIPKDEPWPWPASTITFFDYAHTMNQAQRIPESRVYTPHKLPEYITRLTGRAGNWLAGTAIAYAFRSRGASLLEPRNYAKPLGRDTPAQIESVPNTDRVTDPILGIEAPLLSVVVVAVCAADQLSAPPSN